VKHGLHKEIKWMSDWLTQLSIPGVNIFITNFFPIVMTVLASEGVFHFRG
jgi:hypothetical protein